MLTIATAVATVMMTWYGINTGKEDLYVTICFSFDHQGIVPNIQAKLESAEMINTLPAVDNMASKYQMLM